MRVLLNVSYLGTNYVGWQFQENGISVQETLEKALFEATGLSIRVTGASRTDSGVHALGQRAHFDTPASIPAERYPFVLNRYLPEDVRVMLGQQVPGDFHARFAARELTQSLSRMKMYLSNETDLALFREMIFYQNAHQLFK